MPRIYDNLTEDARLVGALRSALDGAVRADVCVGYFNLRGWQSLGAAVDALPATANGTKPPCRVLVGMQRPPEHELRSHLEIRPDGQDGVPLVDNALAARRKREMAEEFSRQLTLGAPTDRDEAALRRLSRQLRDGRVRVKLFTRHTLHAKLYLVHKVDMFVPILSFLGSSNLTFAGLRGQGELNVDVTDMDAAQKLDRWFQDRWDDRFCVDITESLIEAIESSWARDALVAPHLVYLKMAYHLSQDAREGLQAFRIPDIFGDMLFEFQVAAVKIAARHLERRGGVLIGDVVGLGKTLMATALVRLVQEDQGDNALILCPKNLQGMWEWYREEYGLDAKVVTFSRVEKELPTLRRYRVVLIDESHNLRNPEGKRYAAIRDYVLRNEARCILLSATPYNKHYTDLSAQLKLFVAPDQDLGIRPEAAIRAAGGDAAFSSRHPVNLRTLPAFEESDDPDDWRDLMRRYLVRRTRGFIQTHYAEVDDDGRRYLDKADGGRSYFPTRRPRRVAFDLERDGTPNAYGRLVAPEVVALIDALTLPRYGLAAYLTGDALKVTDAAERKTIEALGRAGVRLRGFCRTNLFKRLESSGSSFLLSIERHLLRNMVYLHALEAGLPLPIGDQSWSDAPLDGTGGDEDPDGQVSSTGGDLVDSDEGAAAGPMAGAAGAGADPGQPRSPAEMLDATVRRRAAAMYEQFAGPHRKRFRWVKAERFTPGLAADLRADADRLLRVLEMAGTWRPGDDPKLAALRDLLTDPAGHATDKVLVFTQFADTATYLAGHLAGLPGGVSAVTGAAADPTALARRFSPISNNLRPPPDELRVLITTDVLSEGQNLQDCHVVVNYDLPWAIIRLIQRVGRVDRIGQEAPEILCHSFLPADPVEGLINLRGRVRLRLRQNAEVVGADEVFFEDDGDEADRIVLDLYNENAGVLDEEGQDTEVDLASQALQIWTEATAGDPALAAAVAALPDVVFATKAHPAAPSDPAGALLYVRTGEGNDALVRVDTGGAAVSHSPLAILRTAACPPGEPALPRQPNHHALVEGAARAAVTGGAGTGGIGLGPPARPRRKVYERLAHYHGGMNVLTPEKIRRGLDLALEDLLRFPLREKAEATLRSRLRHGITDEDLAGEVIALREEGALVGKRADGDGDARIICSLGLAAPE